MPNISVSGNSLLFKYSRIVKSYCNRSDLNITVKKNSLLSRLLVPPNSKKQGSPELLKSSRLFIEVE